ncbi:hypothetical protein AMAG_05164 [Allomyces macrogynus ATCC 38327]|uniref:Cytochrome b-c1 complex subunit 8 n=1 Tax=Allomyces macrogynus (strain ATCC 38327) TaxID=578462 RepID=A0A0L0SB35_ALLM3|nr:ubiquinol--cytochrome-c reductase subunit 8 [Allomyces javanicus]KNE59701.1 hypothetical protein AMAG_05164 [Allomyces macrogynus ATCC 38327]|eukprot:KNE59701.1 hypothetical protein AMAG_05164 [Allomyces macrogynus ATCC 38327]
MAGGGAYIGGPHQAQTGIVTYQISPFRQRAFAGAFKKGVFNVVRRTTAQAPYIIPPFLIGYSMFKYCKDKYAWYHTKEGAAHAGH